MPTQEKMTERKLLKLPPSLLDRLNRTAARDDIDASEIVRRGTLAELDRMDALASVETRRMEKLRKLANVSGEDVEALIDRMLEQVTDPELPLPVDGGGA